MPNPNATVEDNIMISKWIEDLTKACRWCGKRSLHRRGLTGACKLHAPQLQLAYPELVPRSALGFYDQSLREDVINRSAWGRKQGRFASSRTKG